MQRESQASQQSYGYAQQESSTYSGNSASGGSAGGAYYKNCKAIWDVLGYGITRNDLGYRSKLDADGDGYTAVAKRVGIDFATEEAVEFDLTNPMYWAEPNNPQAYEVPDEFRFGTELLVAPIVSNNDDSAQLDSTEVWLPQGE